MEYILHRIHPHGCTYSLYYPYMTNSFVLEDYIHIPDAPIIRVSVSNLVATINDEIIGMLNK